MALAPQNGGVKAQGKASILLLAGLVLLTTGVSIGAYMWKSELPVRRADCEGNRIITTEAVLRLAAVPVDKRIVDIDLTAIRERVLKNPYFRDVSVNRDLPNRILIRVDERVPVAAIIAGRTLYVDSEGVMLTGVRSEYVFDLPVITGAQAVQECKPGRKIVHPTLREALQVVMASQRLGNSVSRRISEIRLQPNGELLLYTAEYGVPVHFGRGNIVDKLALLEGFWTGVVSSRGGQSLRSVDVRFADQVVARWEPSQSLDAH